MPSFTVIDAKVARELPAKDNWPAKNVLHMTLSQNGTEYLVTDFVKTDIAPPAVGETIDVELGEQDKYDKGRRKIVHPRKGGFGGGGSRPRDPKETAAIQRQHQTEMALRYIEIKAHLGKIEDFTFEDVQKLTDAFVRDLEGPVPVSDVPFDATNLA